MKKINLVSVVTCAVAILVCGAAYALSQQCRVSEQAIKVGFIYDGDESTPYTYNFIRAQRAVEAAYGDRVQVEVKNNVPEEDGEASIRGLVEDGCDLVFTNSFGYGEAAKRMAAAYPRAQFCQATCSNANDDPKLDNYHTFMGEVYQGRYVAGVVAGMKLAQLLENGVISKEQALVGYVAAYPYAEVISGYTAFLLGIRSVCPDAVMRVRYTNTWSSYTLEKEIAQQLIAEGCVIISQHSDTIGPAVACEMEDAAQPVYHVGYNQSMLDVAPTTSLVSTRINWSPYVMGAVEAVLEDEQIEAHLDAHIHGNDAGAGFDKDWVQMVELNTMIVADGTEEKLEEVIAELKKGSIPVFRGNYTGKDPFDPSDTCDLSEGFAENENSSAPMFHYVLDDIVLVEE